MKPPLFQRWCNRFLPGFGSWRKAFRSHLSASSLTTLSADEWRDLLVKECETAQKGSPGDPCSAQIQRTIQNDKWRCLLRAYPEAAIFLHDKGYEHSDSKHKAELVAECTGLLETTGLTSADASAVLVEFLGTRPDCQVRMQVVLVQESPTRAVLAELVLTLVDDAVAGNSSCSFVPSPAMRLWLGWDEELQTLADDFKKSLVEAYIQACELAEWPKSCHIIWSLCFSREHPFSHEHPAAPDLSGKSLQLPAAIGLSLLAARNSSVRWKAGLNRDAIARMEPRSLLATGCFGASTDDLKAKLAKFFEFTSNDRESFHAVLLPEDDNNLLHLGESPGKYERTSHPRTWLCRQTKTIPIVARPGLSELLQAVVVEKMIHVSRGPGFQGRLVTPPLASSSPATAPDPVADWMEAESPRVLVIENDDADQAADALARAASKTGWTVMGYWPDSNTADPLVVVQSLVAQARRATQNSDAVPSGGAFHSDPVERELQMLAHCLDSLPEGSKALMILAGVDFISDHHGRSSLPARLAGIVRRHFNTNSELRLILQSGSYAGVPRTDDVKFLELAKGKAGKGNAWNAAGLCELLLARDDHDDPLGWLVCARRLFRRDKTWRTLLGESEAESLKNAIQNASAVLNVPEEDLWRMSMITRRQIMEQLCETDTGKERVKEWHCRWGRRLFMLLHNEPSPQDAAGDMPAAREARQYRLDHVLGHLRLGRLWDNFHEALQNPGFILEHLAQPRGVRRLAKSLEKALSGKTCLPVDHPARPRVSELAFVIHPLADHVLKIDEALARQCLHNSIVEQKETGLRHWLKLFLAATVRLEQAEQACLDQAGQAWLRLLPTASGTSTLGLLPSHTLRKPAPMVAAAFCPQLTAQGRPQVLTFSSDTVQLWKLGETERSFEANTHWAGASSIRQTPVRMLVPGFINGRYAILVSAYGVSIFDTKNGSCQLNMVKLSFRSLTSVLHGRRLYLSVASTPPQLMVYEVRDTGDVSKPFSFAFVSEWKLSEEKMLGGDHAKKNAGGVTDEDADRDIYRSLAVTLDGSLLAVAKMDGVVDVYNTPDLSLTHQDGVVDDYSVPDFSLKHQLPARDRRVDSITFDPDGRFLVVGGGLKSGQVEIWDLNECRATIARVHVNSIWSLGFVRHENEDFLISGGYDRFVKVLSWPALLKLHQEHKPNPARQEIKDGLFNSINRHYHLHYLDLPSGVVRSQRKTSDIGMSLDTVGGWLVAGAAGHPFAVYEMGELLRDPGSGVTTAPVHTAVVVGAPVHAPIFVWAGDDGCIYCRAGLDGAIQVHQVGLAEIHRIDVSQNWIAAATVNGVAVIDRQTAAPSVIWNPTTGIRSDAVRMFKAGGRDLLVCGDCKGSVSLHDLSARNRLWSNLESDLKSKSKIRELAVRVSDDGSKIWIASCGDDSSVRISVLRFSLDSATEPVEEVATIELSDPGLKGAKAHRGRVKSLLWCGNSLVTGGHEFIKVWRLENPKGESPVFFPPLKLEGHVGEIWSLDYQPELDLLASGSQDQTVRVWRLKTARLLASEPRKAPVVCVAWQKCPEAGCGPILHVVDTGVSADPQCSSYELRGLR